METEDVDDMAVHAADVIDIMEVDGDEGFGAGE